MGHKIHPPKLDILEDDPFKDDSFELKDFAKNLTSVLTNIDEPIVLCVDAPWGEGKTTFAKMWIAELKREGKHCVYFDAYEHDYLDDPFISFCAEIISLVEESFAGDGAFGNLSSEFKEKAKRIGARLLVAGATIGVKALTLGIINNSDIEAIKEMRGDLADSGASIVGKAIEAHIESKKSLAEFKENLEEIGKKIKEKQGFPLTVIVDELDRCRPDYALSLIERIKHLFSIENVCFVLLVNREQLENSVERVYGTKMDARTYLQKFFNAYLELPKNRKRKPAENYSKYTYKLIKHYGLQRKLEGWEYVVSDLFSYYDFSLRDMQLFFSTLSLSVSLFLEQQEAEIIVLIVFLIVLQLKNPEIFRQLAAKEIEYEEIITKPTIAKLVNLEGEEYFLLLALKAALLSEHRFRELEPQDKLRWVGDRFLFTLRYSERSDVIPTLCASLTKLKVSDSTEIRIVE